MVIQIIDVVTNSAQITPTRYALNFLGRTLSCHFQSRHFQSRHFQSCHFQSRSDAVLPAAGSPEVYAMQCALCHRSLVYSASCTLYSTVLVQPP